MEREVDVNARDSQLRTPVHYACLNGDAQTLNYLLEAGGNIIDRDNKGWSAVHFAIQSGSFELFNQLTMFEPKVIHLVDYNGGTPLHRVV